MKKKITIALSGLNATDNPGPGIPVARALRESGTFDVRIIGLSYESLEPGIYLHDIIDKTYSVPYPSAGIDSLFERLAYIKSKEDIEVLIPNFDAELFSYIKLENRLLKELNIKTFLPTAEQFEERQKIHLHSFGKRYGLNVPFDKPIYSIGEIYSLPMEFNYPIVIKGKYYDATVVYSADQAKAAFNRISSKWGLPIIVQQFVYGSEFNVIGLGDGNGNQIAAVPMSKKYITDKGKAWAGITIEDENLMEIANRFIKKTKWRGGFELELIKDKNDGKFYILEINPRIPAWVYLAVGVGQNIPDALVKLALSMDVVPYTHYDVGKMFIRYSYDLIVDLKEFEKISTLGEI